MKLATSSFFIPCILLLLILSCVSSVLGAPIPLDVDTPSSLYGPTDVNVDVDTSATSPSAEALRNLVVVSPHIAQPAKGPSYWPKGSKQIIKWDTDKIPKEKSEATGLILLGHSEPGDGSEHLDVDRPLARNFLLTSGEVEVIVPDDVIESDEYFIVLFGDSGNISPRLRIEKPAEAEAEEEDLAYAVDAETEA